MRVLLLVDTLSIGGLPNYVLELARALSEAGDDVAVAHGGEAPSHLELRGVSLLPLPCGPAAERSLRDWRPDLVHVHLCSDARLLAALDALKLPLLRSFHDYTSLCLRRGRRRFPGDRCQRALGTGCLMFGCSVGAPPAGSRWPGLHSLSDKLAERSVYQRFELALVGSQFMRQTLLLNGFAPERVRLVPYFSRFDAQAQGLLPLAPKPVGIPGRDRPLRLLFAGQAVAGKGLKVLVRALAHLEGDWQLTAVTAGPDLPAVQEIAQRLGLAPRIDFKHWLPQPALEGLYRAADLLVVPSVWDDPGPLVGLEAMSLETPVLGFPVGGIPDYAIEGRTGFLADAVSVKSLADALQRAMASGAELAELGRQGRRHVAAIHGRRLHIETIRSLYRAACERRQVQTQTRTPARERVA